MAKETYLVLTFQSVSHSMMTEKELLEEGYEIKTIPTPREISKSCGLSIRTSMDNLEAMREKQAEGTPILHFWKYESEGREKSAEEIT